ncbi:MAG: hypothetical protein PVSMB4_04620 [Ktedonobacterales bacterium]
MEPSGGGPHEALPNPPGADVSAQVAAATVGSASADASARIDAEIARLTRHGYVIVSRTDASVQLRRTKHFSLWWALLWLIVAPGVGLALYIGWYLLIKRDRIVFIRVTPDGRVVKTES